MTSQNQNELRRKLESYQKSVTRILGDIQTTGISRLDHDFMFINEVIANSEISHLNAPFRSPLKRFCFKIIWRLTRPIVGLVANKQVRINRMVAHLIARTAYLEERIETLERKLNAN
jgi:hypothetical protein